jgi:hypothetical protein
MKNKRILHIILTLALVLSIIPLATVSASAGTGAKTLIKTKTVTIKPGEKYKTPKFKISKKMCFQVPLEIWLSPEDKSGDDYISKGGFKIFLKTAKGKTKEKDYQSLENIGSSKKDRYKDWYYYYAKSPAKPNYAKGKYYYVIQNTTKNTIKVKYSVKGYTEFASKASLKSKVKAKSGKYVKAGSIGPGIPLIKKISITGGNSSEFIEVWYHVDSNGKVSLMAYADPCTFTVNIKLANRKKPYKVKMKIVD